MTDRETLAARIEAAEWADGHDSWQHKGPSRHHIIAYRGGPVMTDVDDFKMPEGFTALDDFLREEYGENHEEMIAQIKRRQEIDAIIAGLSEADRERLLAVCDKYSPCNDTTDIGMFRAGLVAQIHLDTWYTTATDFGLAVRAKLEADNG